ncbi:MAG TPA: metalloregulator ArsR/SmtB family transcription factor [Myxococcota bacterium]|nr:metalloregulator ArsR/SmtB family transcription factor [Myxococcota bacterium]
MASPVRARPEGCCAVAPVAALPDAERAALVRALKALADPTRLEIVRLLGAQPGATCVCDVVAAFALSQPTISHHLRLLEEAGLIAGERRGIWSYYALTPGGLGGLAAVLSSLAQELNAPAAPAPQQRRAR